MAWAGSPSLLTASANASGGPSSTTASIIVAAGRVGLAVVEIYDSDGNPPTISLSGGWEEVTGNGETHSDNNDARLVLFRIQGPFSGTITITHNDSSVTYCGWVILEVDRVRLGSNGAAAIRQAVWAKGAGTTMLSTLSAFGSIHNPTFGFCTNDAGGNVTAGSGFAELSEVDGLQVEWKSTNDTSVDATIASSDWAMIGVELIAAASPPMFTTRPQRVWRSWR